MYLAFDPGGTTGWCKFSDEGYPLDWGQDTFDELIDHCDEWAKEQWDAIIYEDFVLWGHKAKQQTGSRMPASQAIGIIKTLIRKTGAEAVVQDSSILQRAQQWTQKFPTGAHADTHWIMAYNHGSFYLINKGIRKTALEIEQEKKNAL